MDRELISKKDLLELTGISYGQLYRWKRKQLIPEEWFVRKSTFTGQETFFPKDLILARIDKILNMKDDLSLDELAGKFSPLHFEAAVAHHELSERNIVSMVVIERFSTPAQLSGAESYSFEQLLYLHTVDRLLSGGEMSLDEAGVLADTLREHFPKFEGKPCELLFTRKMGVSSFALVSVPADVYYDAGVKLVARLSMTEMAERLSGKLG
ncbi:YhbD family protein [Cohnella nanjingensis]|uniref:YhbD family protein n=1 Tax=Cohnella nanjingensis TaxID=1387779 RepID=A0A7X0VIX4_9BACL|nr:YhbD family protein [Cohnella nanjingensis]MBB6674978.1 YhbD family protein [Cohnella nanjingensis]